MNKAGWFLCSAAVLAAGVAAISIIRYPQPEAPHFPTSTAESADYVPVVTYVNSPELNETVGARVNAIFRAHQIESTAVGRASVTVSVRTDRAAEALQLLAKATKAEILQLTLLVPKGDRFVEVSPDAILEPKKTQ